MARIEPSVLKRLRTAKNWSQQELAEKTERRGRPKIDKQTISRLERGERTTSRNRTIQQLADALGVAPAVLTGNSPIPQMKQDEQATPKTQFNVRIEAATRNALYLLAERYFVRPWQVIELAPFLFCWAAEASLRQRRERIKQVEQACKDAKNREREISYFPAPNLTYSEEKIAAENDSINRQDLFGIFLQDANLLDGHFSFDDWDENPFAVFLDGLASEFSEVTEFAGWSSLDSPEYRICPEEALRIAGGDSDAADAIHRGDVPLFEMPKEFWEPGKWDERANWVRARTAEFKQRMIEYLNSKPKKNRGASQ